MSESILRTANIVGAAVLGLHDELRIAVDRRTGRGGETSSAIVVLGHQPGLSNDGLSALLGLTHTGTVRLVDRLVGDGLVERRHALRDRRGVALHLTDAGRLARQRVLKEREAVMVSLVSRISEQDRETLGSLLGRLLNEIARDDTHKLRICRLCDGEACFECPIHVQVGPDGTAPEKELPVD